MLNKVLLEGRVTNILKGSISIKNNGFEMDIIIPDESMDIPFTINSHIFVIGFVDEFGIKATQIKYVGEYRLKTYDNLFSLLETKEDDYEMDVFTNNEREQMEKDYEEKRNKKK